MREREIEALNIETSEIKEFKSLTECAAFFKTSRQRVFQMLQEKQPTDKGWALAYKYEKDRSPVKLPTKVKNALQIISSYILQRDGILRQNWDSGLIEFVAWDGGGLKKKAMDIMDARKTTCEWLAYLIQENSRKKKNND